MMEAKRKARVTTKDSVESSSSCSIAVARWTWTKSPRVLILRRCALYHLIPVAGCVVLIYLNLKTMYLGNNLPGTSLISDTVKLQALQLAAKLHEIFMVTSLSVVALDAVTYRLVHSRRGIPLGVISAGFSLASLDFFLYVPFTTCV